MQHLHYADRPTALRPGWLKKESAGWAGHFRISAQQLKMSENLKYQSLKKDFPTLATITGAEPMLGFLGTVIGMVQSFYAMSQAGNNIEVSMMSDGIYTALITTVAGLIVGILGIFCIQYTGSQGRKGCF